MWMGLSINLSGVLWLMQTVAGADEPLQRLWFNMAFVAGVLGLAALTNQARRKGVRSWPATGLIGAVVITALHVTNHHTSAAWALTVLLFVALVWLDRTIVISSCKNGGTRWVARAVLALTGGGIPVALSQIESHFAEEEFFAVAQGTVIAVFCFLLLLGQACLHRADEESRGVGNTMYHRGLVLGSLTIGLFGLGVGTVIAYQRSFYAWEVPGYPGLTRASPFVCGRVSPDPSRPSGNVVHQRMLRQMETGARKGVPELGMLALGTGKRYWAEAFRRAILEEARAGRFTGPAHSVKSTQYQAALRAYYTPRVRAAFPDLFSDAEWRTLRAWFADINRRALTVEWVDWMYGLGLSKWPEGPYENQENGAGLLAILEAEGLSPPNLSLRNRAYLHRYRRGWMQRFRNSDDAFFYQPEWITNAYFQSLYQPEQLESELVRRNRQLSFEWLLRQALPSGAPLRYNHPSPVSPIGTAYLAAVLESDPRFIWWSARMLDWAAEDEIVPTAQPGAEAPINVQGRSPTFGSCLLYGDSGLPNQPGPLAPDKIVLRDGWTPEAMYLLLNLRFSGWHRYKATNSIVLLYKDGPIVVEKLDGKPFRWLPKGRRLFRDKRVPRENLNGLLIPRTGWSHVTQRLSGIGSRWAQDPPLYARVIAVEWLGPVDISQTVIDDWRGWQHTRTVYFVHQGPVVIIDSARGKGRAAIAWHLVGEGRRDGNGLWLRSTPSPVRMLLPSTAWQHTAIRHTGAPAEAGDIGMPNWDVLYLSPTPGQLDLATVFAVDSWTTMEYTSQRLPGGQFLRLKRRGRGIALLQNDSGRWLQAQGLATDGQWVLTLRRERNRQVCFGGGTHIEVHLAERPVALRRTDGQLWTAWQWHRGTLTVRSPDPDTAVCLDVLR